MRVLQGLDELPRPRVHYAPSPECTRYRQGVNNVDVSTALHVSGNYVEDASPSQQWWKCVTFINPLKQEPEEEAKEYTWDAEGRSLSVCFDLRYVGEDSFCQNLERLLPLIKKLCIHYGHELPRKHPVVDMLTRNKAPQMEILALNYTNQCQRATTDLKPDELFCNNAPRLGWMTVMPGMEVMPSALSQLKRYQVLHQADERMNGFDLHAQLSMMTSLEDLEIVSNTVGKLNWEGRSEIQLQRLRRLTVKDDTNNCEQLLAKIIVPAPCSVEVTFFDPNSQVMCRPTRRYAQDVYSLARQWITAGRDGVSGDRRKIQRTPDANGGGDEVILHISKTGSMEEGWNATWTFGGRWAALVCARVEGG